VIRVIKGSSKKVAFVSSYPPRECGIATFASDLIHSLGLAGGPEFEPLVIAMESGTELKYDQPVELRIRKDIKYDYISAADYINFSDVEVVSVQHEFGLFGGEGGSYLSLLLDRLNKPVITTLHTVLDRPPPEYFDSLTDVCEASDEIIVMNERGIRMLQDIYAVSESKIKLIPHGIPDLSFVDTEPYKRNLGVSGRKTILTFGLLSENKGIEVMLRALPTIVKTDPSVLYTVLGATHPEVLRSEGQSYKLELEATVRDLGLQRNVIFHNRFVSDEELFKFLCAADIYVSPYLHREQLTSGTLAFAVGAGKAIVSTPYWAAQELLAQGRGKLVAFGDSENMARSIIEILRSSLLSSRMRTLAYEHGRSMTWPKVGRAYWRRIRAQAAPLAVSLKPTIVPIDIRIPGSDREQIYQSA